MNIGKTGNYFFLRKGKGIQFEPPFGGNSIICVRSSSAKHNNIRKIVEGLNHFIDYFKYKYNDGGKTYAELGQYFFKKIVEMYNDANQLVKNTDNNFNERFYQLIDKHITFDDQLLECVCNYIHDISIDNIETDRASTEVTLDNLNCRIIHMLTVLIKIGYIYNGVLNNTNNKKEDDYLQFMDKILDQACHAYVKYFKVDRSVDILKSEIHHFFTEFYVNKWNKENTDNFCIKFSEFGMNVQNLADQARMIIYKASRKYTPLIRDPDDKDLMSKYQAKDRNDLLGLVYNQEADWNDFVFPNMNLSKFITTILTNIVKQQDSRRDTPDVNMIDIIQDSYSDSYKDSVLYSDKTNYLYTTRIKLAKDVMDIFVNELAKIYKIVKEQDGDKKANEISDFIINSIRVEEDHLLNRLLINKCLIAIIGEYKTYSNLIFGLSNKNILGLLYFRIITNPELDFLHNIINVIVMSDTKIPVGRVNESALVDLLNRGELEVNKDDFMKLMSIYNNNSNTIEPTIYEMYDLLMLINNPIMLRNVLFPETYPLEFSEEDEGNPFTRYNPDKVVEEAFRKFVV